MAVHADVRPVGPSTWKPVLVIRNFIYMSNGTMTYRRKIRAGNAVHRKWLQAQRKPWGRYFWARPKTLAAGGYEHARRAHIEMERIALRRPNT